jgi:hypothetical protein
VTYRIVKVSLYYNETRFNLTACRRLRLNEESMVALWIKLRRLYDNTELDPEVALAQVRSLVRLSGRAGLRFQGSVASIARNPFTDSHAISTFTDVSVNNLDRVEMSTFQDGDFGGQL